MTIAYNTLSSSDRARVRALTEERDDFEALQLASLCVVPIAALVAGSSWYYYSLHSLQPPSPLWALAVLFAMFVGPVAFIGTLTASVAFGYYTHKAQKEIRLIENGGSPAAPLAGTPRDRDAAVDAAAANSPSNVVARKVEE